MEERDALLELEDGTLFYGRSSGTGNEACGEIVFNTSMTGYQEICTDPSYANQIVLFTTSHVGNVGVNREDDESLRPWVSGIIAREISKTTSNWRAEKSFIDFLNEHNVPWIEGIDTRKLTRHIRTHGTKTACIKGWGQACNPAIGVRPDILQFSPWCKLQDVRPDPNCRIAGLTPMSCMTPMSCIVVCDFGVKKNIVNTLARRGCDVQVVAYPMSADEVLSYAPNGIVLSNGPGDPASIGQNIDEIRGLIFSGVPVLGICLGCQLIALAAGAMTKKMKFGHHGTNHPVYDLQKNKVFITSQNHNYVVDETTLPPEFEVTHFSLFDGSVQGIRAKNYPVIGFQGHPEGSPGPQDVIEVFEQFLEQVAVQDAVRSIY